MLDLTVEQFIWKNTWFEELPDVSEGGFLLDYFVSGFWWTREMNYTCQQISFIMALLQLLLDNIKKQMPFVDNLNEFAKMISGTRQSPSPEVDSLFDAEQAMSITDYLKCSLFQNYQLYEFLFSQPREELLLGKKVRLPASLCPGPACLIGGVLLTQGQRTSQEEDGEVPGETALEQEQENKATGLEGYNVQDVKDVLGDMTKEMLGTLQVGFHDESESFKAFVV
uniref:Ciliary-associated calcium-binding coiled-coil protein 1 n=1 Tax=Oncorhynchus tshawytscha TaxID=74940 RepID=A0AAZ3RF43_ONCTS